MRKIICGSILMLYSELISAQKQGSNTDTTLMIVNNIPYVSKFVTGCDTNSKVVNLSLKMTIPKWKLPKAVNIKEGTSYYLSTKNKKASFSFRQETGNRVSVWINEMGKHCFIISPSCKYSFATYSLSENSLEIYGRIKWNKFYKNFRIIFYFLNNDVFFDFDDEVLKQ